MALSFARPDPSSPASVADAAFATSRRGFDQAEVREFLGMVAAELGRLQERERFLERELRTAQSNPDLASVQLDDAALTRLVGEETARVLMTARESAAEIRLKAEQAAAQLLDEASADVARVREEAEIESARRRSDAAADAEAELSMAKQQGREMVNEARAYRERVLSELARRRELAREQIEQLLHGRDRLMQSFERARLVAVDVIAELQPIGPPEEYVDLSPTTGPVPMMVPGAHPVGQLPEAPRAERESEPEAEEAADEAAPDPADEAAPDPVAIEPSDGEETPAPGDDRVNDDVVVDLFSRLRAESITITDDLDDPADTDTDSDADDPFARRDAELTPLIVAAARTWKRVLADEQNAVLETLRRSDPVAELDAMLPGPDQHAARYHAAIADELTAAAQAGAAMAATAHLDTDDVALAVRAANTVTTEWLIAPMRDRLGRCVAEGASDNADIAKRARAVYREWKTQRIDERLDDVVRMAYGRGVLAAFVPGARIVWTADADDAPCADCDDNRLAGAVTAGDEFPTGHTFAPAHMGCRCLLLPERG